MIRTFITSSVTEFAELFLRSEYAKIATGYLRRWLRIAREGRLMATAYSCRVRHDPGRRVLDPDLAP